MIHCRWWVSLNVHSLAFSILPCVVMVAVAKVPKVKVEILIVTVGKKKKAVPIRIIPLSKVPKPKVVR